MREGELKDEFSAVAERMRHAKLTAKQVAALHSIQYFYTHNGEQRSAKLRTLLIGAVVFLLIAVCLMLSLLSQPASILFDVCSFQVMYIVALLQKGYNYIN